MKYKVPCWNCDDGYVEPADEWDSDVCDVCAGKGFLIVTKLTDDNCEDAIPILEGGDGDNAQTQSMQISADFECPHFVRRPAQGDR